MTEKNYQGENKTEIIKRYSDKYTCKVQNENGKKWAVEVRNLDKLLKRFK